MAVSYKVSDFFKTDLPSWGAYDNTRKIASYIDGQKISMRKIIYTLMKKYPGHEKVKTETVANITAAFTNYLHGAQNLCSVCDTMAQSFIGANNFALLEGNSGGFGTRCNPTCAAPRYTKVALSGIIKKLVNADDEEIVGQQYFEGDWIEPLFFVPVFPMLFLNGSHGLSTGFSQDIWPRNPSEVIEYIKKKLAGTEHPRMSLLPWFRGHLGKVAYNKELDRNESFGVITKNTMTSYTITELPIGIEYQKYVEFLDKLCDSSMIVDYSDKCDPKTDKILFEVKTTRDFTKKHEDERKLQEAFHLVKSLPETLCCLDESSRVREFSSVQEILDAFIDIRLKYYSKRKAWLLDTLKSSMELLVSKYVFIKAVVDKKVIVSNKKKDDILKQVEKLDKVIKQDGTYDYLLKMPIWQLTYEKLEELKKQIQEAKDTWKKTKETSIQDMWTADLHELKKALG
jgi:DNA topoisomerase II